MDIFPLKSIFNNIFKLEPGKVVEIKKRFRNQTKYSYWDIKKIINKKRKIDKSKNYNDYLNEVERKIKSQLKEECYQMCH